MLPVLTTVSCSQRSVKLLEMTTYFVCFIIISRVLCRFIRSYVTASAVLNHEKSGNNVKNMLIKLLFASATVAICSFVVTAQNADYNSYSLTGNSSYGTARQVGNTTYYDVYSSTGNSSYGTARQVGRTTYYNTYPPTGSS